LTLARPLLVLALAFAVWAPTASADSNPNNLNCKGHISAGKAQPADDDVQVAYAFGCDGPITGYQIQPQIGDTGFDTATSVFTAAGDAVVTDSFTCQGSFPGFGINCTGTYRGGFNAIKGQFSIAGKLCDEPRVDPLLTVVTATADARGVITQSISGPFDLGRPQGCKGTPSSGKLRIPADGSLPVATPAPPARKPLAKKHKKAAAKKKPAPKAVSTRA
jgi:hypothetical protein